MPIGGEEYKQLLANWPSGVTIVTSRDGDRIQGMTASAFTEVSLIALFAPIALDPHHQAAGVILGARVEKLDEILVGVDAPRFFRLGLVESGEHPFQ